MKAEKWAARIHRARELASAHPCASQGLHFYERIAGFQASLYSEIQAACSPPKARRTPATLRQEFDSYLLLPRFAPFLSLIETIAPAHLAQFAHELRGSGSSRWHEILMRFWETGLGSQASLGPEETLLSWVFLQPYAEYLANHSPRVAPTGTPPVCPLCGGKPQAGVLRPEGDGAKRSLICALCALEWDYRRLVCPACGEEDVHKLAVYTAEEFKHMRVEACDACHTYLKTVDLTKDGLAVPVVDELATLPLDLWAGKHGYLKLQTNILGI